MRRGWGLREINVFVLRPPSHAEPHSHVISSLRGPTLVLFFFGIARLASQLLF